ncbi:MULTISPECIES: TonB-dependent receptor [unclassified Empedobacter]|uniref:TonB-dependent receptor n=1 Tax=unclassified Empedobacter TaxID=2643773 RepID=UPI0025BB35C6|nr:MULTISPECIES: TonB-dependent receptor [unclassified Empedobacter]
MKIKLKLLLLFLLTSICTFAQNYGIVEGKIVSSDGYPVAGITIKIGKSTNTTITDENGEFRFEKFPEGQHSITLEGEGLKKQTKSIEVHTNEVSEISFTLNENITTLSEVVIKIVESPNKKQESILSGLNVKGIDLPQSFQIIDNQVIEQQQSIKLSDVVKNVNGVYVGSARGAAQESFWSRGYDMSSNNIFKNGFRFNNGSIPEVSSLERVEVLKGGAALLYGNVAPGGILNMVTKKPKFNFGGEISMQAGSNAFYKPSLDIYGPINNSIAYRFTGSYENSESFRNDVKRERFYVNPSFLFKMTDKTELVLQADYLNDDWTPDFGTAIIGKEIVDLPRSMYLGATWSNGKTKQASTSALVKHNFNKDWQLNFNSSFQQYDRESKGTERIQPDAKGNWSRPLGQNKNQEQLYGEQLNLQGNFNTGKIKHQLLTGVDFDYSSSKAFTYVFDQKNYGSGNIFDFENFDQGGAIPMAKNTKIASTKTGRFGVYFQDLISLTDQLKVLAGLRWSWQEAQVTTRDLTKTPVDVKKDGKRVDEAFSPKVGIVFQPIKDMAIFASYSNSFTPNSGTTVDLKAIKPSIIDQYEVGIKNDFFRGLLSTNVTLYQIKNNNLAQTAEFKADGTPNTDSTIKVLSGATKSKGIEVDVTAHPIIGLNIMAGYSYNDMRYTKTSGLKGSFVEGDRLTRTPANTANLSFHYTLQNGALKGFSIGALANYIGKRIGGWNNQIDPSQPNGILDREIPLSAYTTIDVSAGYKWKNFSLLCRLSNITNELNYNVHENYSVNPIAPRQLMTTLRYKF